MRKDSAATDNSVGLRAGCCFVGIAGPHLMLQYVHTVRLARYLFSRMRDDVRAASSTRAIQ